MHSGEYDACDVALSVRVYPHQAGLKNMPGHGGKQTYNLWIINGKIVERVTSVKWLGLITISSNLSGIVIFHTFVKRSHLVYIF